jgi:RNA polymerase sigma factor (sigma-70 family)
MALIDPVQTYTRKARAAPETLVRTHMQLVRKIAWHVHARVASAIEIEDLVQIGMIALVEAANGYEDRGHAFGTYATMRIRGAMIDHLRKNASICRSAMARRREMNASASSCRANMAARRPTRKWPSRWGWSRPNIANWSRPSRPGTRAWTRSIPTIRCGSPTSRSAPTTRWSGKG